MEAVSAAFDAVPRAGFLPADAQGRAGYDGPVAIGAGQTNSQPRTVEAMLRLLDVRPRQRVLDLGSGSGWTTALLAHLVGPGGSVLGLELEPELAAWGADNLRATGLAQARIREAQTGVLGAPGDGPFDRILVSAEGRRLPDELVDQLAADGRMVIPVRGTMLAVAKSGGQVDVSRHGSYRFVPLR